MLAARLKQILRERKSQLIEHLWTTGRGFEYAGSAGTLREPSPPNRASLASDKIAKLIEDYLSWDIVNTPQAIIAALAIEARYKVSYRDALILQADESCGAALVHSEDLSHSQRYGAVEVVDPLR